MNLNELRRLLREDSFAVTSHCLRRMIERGIALAEAKSAILDGEIIEDYPDDFPYPSCLILGNGLHVVAGIGEEKLWLITAYRPDRDQWEDDLRTRKEKRA